jgi:hypothetical protein
MTDDRRTESGKPTARARRETRLAAALRANLKRRKAAAKGEAGPADSPKAGQKAPAPNRPPEGR